MQPVPNLEQYVDVEDALTRVCGNRALYRKLLGKFKESLAIDQLMDEIASGDLSVAAKTAHSIKGVTANLSLKAAYEKSVAVEAALKQGMVNATDIAELKDIIDTTVICADYIIECIE